MAAKKTTKKKAKTNPLAKAWEAKVEQIRKLTASLTKEVQKEKARIEKLDEKNSAKRDALDEKISALGPEYPASGAVDKKREEKQQALREQRDAIPDYDEATSAIGSEDSYADYNDIFAGLLAIEQGLDTLAKKVGKSTSGAIADYFDTLARAEHGAD